MKPPTSPKELCQFIGVVNYYCDMWARHSHKLVILTNISSIEVKFIWNKIEQDAFNTIKQIVARDTLLAYPDFNEEFKINTDARRFQLGEVIIQKVKPIAFYD